MAPHLRVARLTSTLERTAAMYRAGLDLEEIGSFSGHDGFDGVMLGEPGGPYHLEFTSERGGEVVRAPSQEDLLVFYEPDPDAWSTACSRMLAAGFVAVRAHNPYWDACGRTFEDLDGYRVVFARMAWPPDHDADADSSP